MHLFEYFFDIKININITNEYYIYFINQLKHKTSNQHVLKFFELQLSNLKEFFTSNVDHIQQTSYPNSLSILRTSKRKNLASQFSQKSNNQLAVRYKFLRKRDISRKKDPAYSSQQ